MSWKGKQWLWTYHWGILKLTFYWATLFCQFSDFSGCHKGSKYSFEYLIFFFFPHLASIMTDVFLDGQSPFRALNCEKWQNPSSSWEKRHWASTNFFSEGFFFSYSSAKFLLLVLSKCSAVFFSLLILLILTCDLICNGKAYLAEEVRLQIHNSVLTPRIHSMFAISTQYTERCMLPHYENLE